jgi:hypothetical protein
VATSHSSRSGCVKAAAGEGKVQAR